MTWYGPLALGYDPQDDPSNECPACDGSGTRKDAECPYCGGYGVAPTKRPGAGAPTSKTRVADAHADQPF